MGEAKASGNLGNTLKVLGRFDEAIVCCQRHLDIAQEQGDKVSGQTLGPLYPFHLCWSSYPQTLSDKAVSLDICQTLSDKAPLPPN